MVWLSAILFAFASGLAARAAMLRQGRRRTGWLMLSVAYSLLAVRRLALTTLTTIDYVETADAMYHGTDRLACTLDVVIMPIVVSGLILAATVIASGPHA